MSFSPMTQRDFPSLAVSTGSQTGLVLCNCGATGIYSVAVYAAPTTISTTSSVTMALAWTDGGVPRTWTSGSLSLANLLASNIVQEIVPCRCDAGTQIKASIAVVGTDGRYTATFGVRQPQ